MNFNFVTDQRDIDRGKKLCNVRNDIDNQVPIYSTQTCDRVDVSKSDRNLSKKPFRIETIGRAEVFPQACHSQSSDADLSLLAYRYLDRADKTSASPFLGRLQKAPFDEGDTREYRARSSIHNTRPSFSPPRGASSALLLPRCVGAGSPDEKGEKRKKRKEKIKGTDRGGGEGERHDRRWRAPSTGGLQVCGEIKI